MRNTTLELLQHLGLSNPQLRDSLRAALDQYVQSYEAKAVFIATLDHGVLEVVLGSSSFGETRIALRQSRVIRGKGNVLHAEDLSLSAEFVGFNLHCFPLRAGDGEMYARLCALVAHGSATDVASHRFKLAQADFSRRLMELNYRLEFQPLQFDREDYWQARIRPDIQMASATGSNYAMALVSLQPTTAEGTRASDQTYASANLAYLIRREKWPELVRIGQFYDGSLAAAPAAKLDEMEAAGRHVIQRYNSIRANEPAVREFPARCQLAVFPKPGELLDLRPPQVHAALTKGSPDNGPQVVRLEF